MHFHTLAHSAYLLWIISWAKGAAFGWAVKKAWAVGKAAVALIHHILTLPAQLAALLSEQLEGLLKVIVAGFLFAAAVGAIGTFFCLYRRGARIPLPTAC